MESAPAFLINLLNGETWAFQFFPSEGFDTEDQTNYAEMESLGGVKPSQYINEEAQRITISQAWLDSTRVENESLTEKVEKLRALGKRGKNNPAPPILLLVCGDWQPKVVMRSLNISKKMFSETNQLLRVQMSMRFDEWIPRESVTVTVVDEDSGSGIGDF